MEYNIYCDESCHLENDRQPFMVLGAIWQPNDTVREVSRELAAIKAKHGLPPSYEIKWTKVSASSKLPMFQDVVNYFFQREDVNFRAIVIEKSKIDHSRFDQTHDLWYYKMFFQLLEVILSNSNAYNVYLDIKDTRSQEKVNKLHECLCNAQYDFDRKIVRRVQQIHSHESQQMQLADLLIGAVQYANRGVLTNTGKSSIVSQIRDRTGFKLTQTTLLGEKKFNLLNWRPRA